MRRLIAISVTVAVTVLLAACSTVGINTASNGRSLDPLRDDVASLLIAFDLPRGLGPNNAAGQLFTFDVANGGPQEHLRLSLVPADADQVAGNLPPPGDGRAYYLYNIAENDKPAIRAAQQAAQARGISASSIQIGVVPHLCGAGQVDKNLLTVSIYGAIPGQTRLMPFMNQMPLAAVLQQPGSTQLAICQG
ncbi:MAG: hypothetical protein ACTHKD_05630 [Devosia sp.]|jgi:hypothetical protein|nr:hypothetical protein [Devosia sp.]